MCGGGHPGPPEREITVIKPSKATTSDRLVAVTPTPPGDETPLARVSDEAKQTGIQANLRSHREAGGRALAHERNAARLAGEIEQGQREYEQLRKRLEELGQQLTQASEERDREQHYARQEREAEAMFGQLVVTLGGPVPPPMQDATPPASAPTPVQGADRCPTCGEPMQWNEKHGFIHPIEGGFELAGQSCHRRARAGDTQVLPSDGAL